MTASLYVLLRNGLLLLSFGCCAGAASAQATAGRLLAWVEGPEQGGGVDAWLRERVRNMTDYVVRATSPDLAAANRRLWMIDLSTGAKCQLSPDAGVREPRWGRGGHLLYLVDADTNGDGRIDFNDEHRVRLMLQGGDQARTLTEGSSAVWSPDGRRISVASRGKVSVIDLDGNRVAFGSNAVAGWILVADRRSVALVGEVWSLDTRDGTIQKLSEKLIRKYLWLGGALTRDGKKVAFPNAQRTDLFVGDPAAPDLATNVTQDDFLDLDPAWSPDETRLAYVSSNPSNDRMCTRR